MADAKQNQPRRMTVESPDPVAIVQVPMGAEDDGRGEDAPPTATLMVVVGEVAFGEARMQAVRDLMEKLVPQGKTEAMDFVTKMARARDTMAAAYTIAQEIAYTKR